MEELPNYEKALEAQLGPGLGASECTTNATSSNTAEAYSSNGATCSNDAVAASYNLNTTYNGLPPTYEELVPGGHKVMATDQTGYGNPGYITMGSNGYIATTQSVAVVQQPRTVLVTPYSYAHAQPSIVGPILYSCLVYWCFCPILGLSAFIVAVLAGGEVGSPAYAKIHISNILSTIGLVIGIMLYITLIIIISVD